MLFMPAIPEVLDAVISDVMFHGRGTISIETETLIHHAFGADMLAQEKSK